MVYGLLLQNSSNANVSHLRRLVTILYNGSVYQSVTQFSIVYNFNDSETKLPILIKLKKNHLVSNLVFCTANDLLL